MQVKDSKQARVHILYDGRVVKEFLGPMADERFQNECRVLEYLARKKCNFVPRLIEYHPETLRMVTSNCGKIVDKLPEDKVNSLFAELESYGVRHEDPFVRNITYNERLGRFCIIDFEFATILETGEGLTVTEVQEYTMDKQRQDGEDELARTEKMFSDKPDESC